MVAGSPGIAGEHSLVGILDGEHHGVASPVEPEIAG